MRVSNDSSDVRELLLGLGHRNDGQGASLEPRSSLRSELLPMDDRRGSLGMALSSHTQHRRSNREPASGYSTCSISGGPIVTRTPSPIQAPSAGLATPRSCSPFASPRNRSVSPRGNQYLEAERVANAWVSKMAVRSGASPSRSPRNRSRDASPSNRSRDGTTPRNFTPRNGSPRNSARSANDDYDGGGQTARRLASSSPLPDGLSPAGRPCPRSVPRENAYRETTSDVNAPEWSPENTHEGELPKGRTVLVDKNAPSDHWMANPSSKLTRKVKYDWQHGEPELQWKRHVPSAIPVNAMKDRRMADPGGRPWNRQYKDYQKNACSDPWAFQGGRTDCPPPEHQDREDKGKRMYGEGMHGRSKNASKNLEFLSTPRSDVEAGLDSRHINDKCRRSEGSPMHTRATRRQYYGVHRNGPSDPECGPIGVPPPAADYWAERNESSPRTGTRPKIMDETRLTTSPLRRISEPGDRGLSPITGKRRSHLQPPRVGSPMWRR